MRNSTVFRSTMCMLVLALACSASRVESSVEPTDLVVTVAANRSSVSAGQDLQISITATNGALTARTLQFSSSCFTDFEFLDSSGKLVGGSQQTCLQVLTQKTLEPGASVSGSHTWTRGPLGFPQLGPGSYQLRAVLLTTPTPIRSAPILITIP